jgi:hypothetical protein
MARQSTATSHSRTCGQIVFLGEWKPFSWHSFCDVRFGTPPLGKARFVAIGRQ